MRAALLAVMHTLMASANRTCPCRAFFSDVRDYVYRGVDSSRGGVRAHHWVTYPGDPYRQRDVWMPVNKTPSQSAASAGGALRAAGASSSSSWDWEALGVFDLWETLGDFSRPETRYGQWVYRWTVGVDPKTFETC